MSRLNAITQFEVLNKPITGRTQYGGMGVDQLKELKRLQKENEQLRRAVSDLTLDKLILKEAARGNFSAPLVVALALILCATSSKSRSVELVGCWGNIFLHRDMSPKDALMKTGLFLI